MPRPRIASPAVRIFGQLGDDGRALRIAALGVKRVRVRARVHFADLDADARRGFDLRKLRVDEHRRHDAGIGQLRHRRAQLGLLPRDVEAALGGDLVPPFRHQHRHFGLDAARDAEHFRRRRPSRGSA